MSNYDDLMVSDTIHEREVELADGSKRVLYFKEVPAVVYRRFLIAEQSDDDDVRSTSLARLIQASMCEPDGKPALTLDQALRLKAGVSGKLVDAVLDVNGKAPGKNA